MNQSSERTWKPKPPVDAFAKRTVSREEAVARACENLANSLQGRKIYAQQRAAAFKDVGFVNQPTLIAAEIDVLDQVLGHLKEIQEIVTYGEKVAEVPTQGVGT